MGGLRETGRRGPGYTLEVHTDVKPDEINSFRLQAALSIAGRELSEKELEEINAQGKKTLIEMEFEGLRFTGMKHSNGSFTEIYSGKDNWCRLVYNPARGTLKIQRHPRSN